MSKKNIVKNSTWNEKRACKSVMLWMIHQLTLPIWSERPRHTIKKRMRQKIRDLKTEMKRRMHAPVPEQGRWLRAVLQGHFAYYAVPTNYQALGEFRTAVVRQWLRTLRRRSHKHNLAWRRFNAIVDRWLPRARTLHPWPEQRCYAITQGRSPVQ